MDIQEIHENIKMRQEDLMTKHKELLEQKIELQNEALSSIYDHITLIGQLVALLIDLPDLKELPEVINALISASQSNSDIIDLLNFINGVNA